MTDGRRLLDLVEVRGGVAGAEATYRTWVADDAEAALLDARTPAREAYAVLDETDGAWSPPAGLRAAMTDWAFDEAETARAAIGADAAAAAGQVQQAARAAGLPDPAAVRAQYEDAGSAEEYAALATELPRAVEVVGSVGDAVAAASGGGPLADLGRLLLDVDGSVADARAALDDGRLDDAATAADDASSRAAAAPWLGTGSVLLVVVALAGVVLLLVRRRARRRAQPDGAPAVDVDRPDDATPGGDDVPAADEAPADGEPTPDEEPAAEDEPTPGEAPSVGEEPEPVKA